MRVPRAEFAKNPCRVGMMVLFPSPFGVTADMVSTTLNIFMNVWPESSGELHIDPPTSAAGDRFTVRAEMDLHVGLTACSAEKSNGGTCKPIDYVVHPA